LVVAEFVAFLVLSIIRQILLYGIVGEMYGVVGIVELVLGR